MSHLDTVAAEVVRRAAEYSIENDYVGWEEFPEIGEFDWIEVSALAQQMVAQVDAGFHAAYSDLAARAEQACGDWPAPCNHDPAHERTEL